MMDAILGLPIPPFADSAEFGAFVKSVYTAVDRNYLSASHVLKCDPMTVWRIVNGKQKDSPKLRKQWNIRLKTRPAPVCPIHGIVHCFDCETERVVEKETSKPPSNKKRAPRPRASISTESARSAAGTILKKTSSEFRQELVRLLLE